MSYGPNTNIAREHSVCAKCGENTVVQFVTKVRIYNGMFCRKCDESNYYASMRQEARERKAQRLERIARRD